MTSVSSDSSQVAVDDSLLVCGGQRLGEGEGDLDEPRGVVDEAQAPEADRARTPARCPGARRPACSGEARRPPRL
jgi:hypothetical protein